MNADEPKTEEFCSRCGKGIEPSGDCAIAPLPEKKEIEAALQKIAKAREEMVRADWLLRSAEGDLKRLLEPPMNAEEHGLGQEGYGHGV